VTDNELVCNFSAITCGVIIAGLFVCSMRRHGTIVHFAAQQTNASSSSSSAAAASAAAAAAKEGGV